MDRIYRLVLRLGLLLLSPYLLLRSRRYWPTLADRLGRLQLPRLRNTIWVHAVSVGEVKAVEKLLLRIREEFPDRPLVVSTTTPTGQQLAREKTAIIDHAFYFPFDLPRPVSRVLDRIQPQLVVIAETEIWPTFLTACRSRSVPVIMVNGRISDRSFPRYRRVRRWLGPVLNDYAVLGMQSETDGRRIEQMGAEAQRVQVLGNLKYDAAPADRPLDAQLAAALRRWQPLWIAASTMPGEDEMVLDTFIGLRQSRPQLKLLVAPRHPERAAAVAGLARARSLRTLLRSALRPPHNANEDGEADVIVLDTIGELAAIFEMASIVFVGGSLVKRGGHNILEPARFARPIVFGPHMENFRDIARLFLNAGAAVQVGSAAGLQETLARLLSESDLAAGLGANARRLLLENSGATERVLRVIEQHIPAR
jgi:3-deoxy-D-manno-octulosonic-acid transferase